MYAHHTQLPLNRYRQYEHAHESIQKNERYQLSHNQMRNGFVE